MNTRDKLACICECLSASIYIEGVFVSIDCAADSLVFKTEDIRMEMSPTYMELDAIGKAFVFAKNFDPKS